MVWRRHGAARGLQSTAWFVERWLIGCDDPLNVDPVIVADNSLTEQSGAWMLTEQGFSLQPALERSATHAENAATRERSVSIDGLVEFFTPQAALIRTLWFVAPFHSAQSMLWAIKNAWISSSVGKWS
jgi:hypothetical protein